MTESALGTGPRRREAGPQLFKEVELKLIHEGVGGVFPVEKMGWIGFRILSITVLQKATLINQIWALRGKLFATLGVMETRRRKACTKER